MRIIGPYMELKIRRELASSYFGLSLKGMRRSSFGMSHVLERGNRNKEIKSFLL
jgi:hypothetical protein